MGKLLGKHVLLIRQVAPGLFLMAKYLQLRGRIYYYVREIPEELRPRFGGKITKRISLRTSDEQVAAREASKRAAEDDALWKAMRANASLAPPEVNSGR